MVDDAADDLCAVGPGVIGLALQVWHVLTDEQPIDQIDHFLATLRLVSSIYRWLILFALAAFLIWLLLVANGIPDLLDTLVESKSRVDPAIVEAEEEVNEDDPADADQVPDASIAVRRGEEDQLQEVRLLLEQRSRLRGQASLAAPDSLRVPSVVGLLLCLANEVIRGRQDRVDEHEERSVEVRDQIVVGPRGVEVLLLVDEPLDPV